MRYYIDEYFVENDEQRLIYNFNDIKQKVIELHNNNKSIKSIVKYIQEWLYIFNDKDETQYETNIVKKIIKNEPIINRFSNKTFQ